MSIKRFSVHKVFCILENDQTFQETVSKNYTTKHFPVSESVSSAKEDKKNPQVFSKVSMPTDMRKEKEKQLP